MLFHDVFEPARVGHKGVAQCQGVQFHRLFHLATVCQEQGYRGQCPRQWHKGANFGSHPQSFTEVLLCLAKIAQPTFCISQDDEG